MFIGQCIIVIVEEWKTNLMSLVILYVLNMFRTLIYPSSGACDNMLPSEMNDVEDPIPSDQSRNNQIDMGKNESIRRTSTRNKKAPSTMSKDFLW